MEKDNNKSYVEIVDTPPTDTESLYTVDESIGSIKLSKEQVYSLFKGRNLVFISTLSADGFPHITPIWADIDEENDIILVNTSDAAVKKRNVTRNPRVALCVVDQYNPYNMVSIKGIVIEQTYDNADEHLQKLAKKYLGIGKYYYRKPQHKRVILKIKPKKIIGLSLHPAFYFLGYFPWKNKEMVI